MRLPRSVPTLLVAVLATSSLAAGCGDSDKDSTANTGPATTTQAASATSAVTVSLSEWAVGTDTQATAAGPVRFTVKNTGKVPHELVVLRTTKKADALGRGLRVSEATSVGEAGDVAPGATKTVSLKLTPGHYSLICNLPDHYAQGMHTDLTVS